VSAADDPRARPAPASFLALSREFASGAASPSAFLEQCLARIETLEPEVKAFVVIDKEAARQRAAESSQRWAKGAPLSAVDGMPIGVKDVIETADMPTGMGSPLFEGVRTGKDSASVKALRSAGAIILGKTVTTEFASAVPGPTRNPWDVTRTPGGSSSGSAAGVASGMISAGLGTQVVGSIIRPASFCGSVGFKPSLGAINRGGSHDFMSQSCQGVLAASLADAWCVLSEIAARAGGDPGFAGLQGPSSLPDQRRARAVAVLETAGFARASAGARRAFAEACAAIETSGVEILTRRDSPDLARLEEHIGAAAAQTRKINAWESIWPLNVYRDLDTSKISPSMLAKLEEAEAMSISDYRLALAARDEAREAFEQLRGKVDAFITLSASGAASPGMATGDPAFSVPASYLGAPAASLPVLWDEGLPLGLQLIGFRDEDAAVFGYARALLAEVFQARTFLGLAEG
jgi:Asp-tRNA(Asn)/Glu-tRNA(Gln) amidotransferase A subunit family amidase